MARTGEKYFVFRNFGLYLLDRTDDDFYLDDYPSCIWLGDDAREGQRLADQYNRRLIKEGKVTAERVAQMRGSRIKAGL